MKRIIQILLLVVIYLIPQACFAQSEMVKTSRSDSKNKIQMFFTFDNLPKHSVNPNGKRIDIIFDSTSPAKDITFFESDERIVKVLTSTRNNKTTLSLFLRYYPKNVSSAVRGNMVVVELSTGDTFTKAYTDFATQLEGLSIIERDTIDFSNPYITSPYVGNWKSFFIDYEPSLSVLLDVKYTLPPFPAISMLAPLFIENETILPPDSLEHAQKQQWSTLVMSLQPLLEQTVDQDTKKKLALTYGEVLMRNGDFENAYKQLYLLATSFEREQVGLLAKYYLALLRSIHEDPFIGDVKLKELENSVHPRSPLAPYFLLSRIESSLVTKQYTRMGKLLKEDKIGLPEDVRRTVELRHADFLFVEKKSIKAYVVYNLLDDLDFIADHPFSLSGYCSTLYDQKRYPQAASCFEKLRVHAKDSSRTGMINYIKSMADLKFLDPELMGREFSSIEDSFPGTDAGFKAAVKKTDLRSYTENDWNESTALYYKAFAERGVAKITSEESALKEAITLHIMGQNNSAIPAAQNVLREYRFGELTETTEALLLEIIPEEIKRLVKNKEYFKALVIAKQNRRFFQQNWLDVTLLADLATSYSNVGIYKEAERMYLYLIEVLPEDQKGAYYLPLIKSIYIQGDYDLVEDYASHYLFNYEGQQDSEQIQLLYLKALFQQKKFDEALEKIPYPLPDNFEFRKFTASVFYHSGNTAGVITILEPYFQSGALADTIDKFVLADSYFEQNSLAKAKTIFMTLIKDEIHGQQTLYRLATIEERLGNKEASLKLFKQLVETEKESPWKMAAKKELEFDTFNEEFEKIKTKIY